MSEASTVIVGPWPERRGVESTWGLETLSRVEAMETLLGSLERLTDVLEESCRERQEISRLRAELVRRSAIDRATGMVMFRYGLDAERALEVLSRWSRQADTDLQALALTLIEIACRDPESPEVDLFVNSFRAGGHRDVSSDPR
jgi:hypothetical protein